MAIPKIPVSPMRKRIPLVVPPKEVSKPPSVSREDILQASKAIHDSLKGKLLHEIKSLETSLTLTLAKALEGKQETYVGEKLEGVENSLEDKLKDFIDEVIQERLKQIVGVSLDRLDEVLLERLHHYDTRMSSLEGTYQTGLEQVKDLLKSLPIPQVSLIIPENAIEIKQLPSIVNLPEGCIQMEVKQLPSLVTLPEGCIQIEVKQLPSIVNLPEGCIQMEVKQLPSIVNVGDKAFNLTVDQPAPQVSFNIPSRKITKHIAYDEYGRPTTITENEE